MREEARCESQQGRAFSSVPGHSKYLPCRALHLPSTHPPIYPAQPLQPAKEGLVAHGLQPPTCLAHAPATSERSLQRSHIAIPSFLLLSSLLSWSTTAPHTTPTLPQHREAHALAFSICHDDAARGPVHVPPAPGQHQRSDDDGGGGKFLLLLRVGLCEARGRAGGGGCKYQCVRFVQLVSKVGRRVCLPSRSWREVRKKSCKFFSHRIVSEVFQSRRFEYRRNTTTRST